MDTVCCMIWGRYKEQGCRLATNSPSFYDGGVTEPTSELQSDREILAAILLSACSFQAVQRAAAELQPDRSRKRKTCGRKKQWTRRAEARQRELMPAANWISEQRGGRVVNVT